MSIDRCFNLEDFRRMARKRLPAPLFHFMDGGADDEKTLTNNTTIFDSVHLKPSMLTNTDTIDMSVSVLGRKIEWPVFLAPTGTTRLFHHEGERACARAAAKAGTIYAMSTMSNVTIEEIGALTDAPKCFQLYIHRDRALTREFVKRARSAGFTSLCLTVDTLVAGNRERDHKTGMVVPPKLTVASLASFAWHWRWTLDYFRHDPFELVNLTNNKRASDQKLTSIIDYVNSQFDPSITWDDAEAVIAEWNGPFAIKGIMTAADARKAVDIGATAIMVSNHGGRQLDGAPSPFECIADIADAVGDKADVILDGGIRRGSHVLKALAMGATACSIGRGYLYPLAAGGEAGVDRYLSRLRAEIERDMILMGCDSLSKLNRSMLQRAGIGLETMPAQTVSDRDLSNAHPRVVA